MKDVEYAETNEKSILQFLRFLVFEVIFMYSKLVSFSMNLKYKIDHNSINRKNWKIDFSIVLGHCVFFVYI